MARGRFRVESLVKLSQAIAGRRGFKGVSRLGVVSAACLALAAPLPAHAQEFSGAATQLISAVRTSSDNQGLPFVVVDKKEARVYVLDGRGRLIAETAALLGLARGDHSVPGIGDRPLADIRPAERTTPAGRFVAEPGRNVYGEHVIWIDYDAALALHRVRDNGRDRLSQRLWTATPDDNRISYGCVVVPVEFYESVVKAAFTGGRGVVYILPETVPWKDAFHLEARSTHLSRLSSPAPE